LESELALVGVCARANTDVITAIPKMTQKRIGVRIISGPCEQVRKPECNFRSHLSFRVVARY